MSDRLARHRSHVVRVLLIALLTIGGATARAQQSPAPAPPGNPDPPAAPAVPAPAAPQAPSPAAPATPAQPPASPATPAQPPASAATPAAQPAGKAGAAALAFTGEAGIVLFTVKADGAADFEAFFAKVKDALAKGTKPEYKQMAAGWKLYKVTEAGQTTQVMYASVIDPAVKGGDYDPIKILSDVAPADAVALYPKLKDAIVSVNRLNLTPALAMGQ